MTEKGPYRVLIVDDERTVDSIARHLEGIDDLFVTRVAESIEQGVAHVTTGTELDCVVSEFELPSGSGLELLETIREYDPDIPFVLFTSADSEAIDGSAVSSEVAGVVQKTGDPTQYDHLTERILETVTTESRHPPLDEFSLLESIVDHATDAVVAIDETSTIRFASEATQRIFGYSSQELVGESLTTLMPDRFEQRHLDGMDRYFRTGDRELDWGRVEFPGLHAAGHEVPLAVSFGEFERRGQRYFTGIVRDITERKAMEQELERTNQRLSGILEASPLSIIAVDLEGRVQFCNRVAEETFGWTFAEMEDERLPIVPDEKQAEFDRHIDRARKGDRVIGKQTSRKTKDGEEISVRLSSAPLRDPNGNVTGAVGIFEDITEEQLRKQRLERSERRYRTLVEMAPDPILVHSDGNIVYANEAFVQLMRADSDMAVLDTPITDYLDTAEQEDAEAEARRTQRGDRTPTNTQRVMRTLDGDRRYVTMTSRPVAYQGESAVLTIITDRTDEHRYQQAVEALHEHTRAMFQHDDTQSIAESAVEAAEDLLDLPGAIVFEFDESRNALVPIAQSAGAKDVLGDAVSIDSADDHAAWDTFVSGEPTSLANPVEDSWLTDKGNISSSLYVPLGNHGVFATAAVETAGISETAVELCSILAANLEAALDRVHREHRLGEQDQRIERQTSTLEELHRLNRTIRDVNRALLQETSREGIEAATCEQLGESDEYSAVWIGHHDDDGGTVIPEATGSSPSGLMDWIRDTSSGSPLQSVVTEALTSGEVQHVPRVLEDPTWADERQAALKYDFRSLIAVPIPVRNANDRVLVIHAIESDAFTDRHLGVFTELGALIGAALAALGASQSQLTESLTEVELRIDDDRLILNRGSDRLDVEMTLKGGFPISDRRLVGILEAAVSPDEMETLAESLSQVTSVRCLAEGEESSLYELEGPMTPFFEVLYEHDARLSSMTATNGTTTVVVWLSESVPVKDFVDDVSAVYPGTELVAKRSREADIDTSHTFRESVKRACTDRQFQALQAAYYGGFYDWPRDASNEDLAEVLGIASPTFQSHRRAAERVVISHLFEPSR